MGWRRWELAVGQPSHALDGCIGEALCVELNGRGTLPTERVERALEDVKCEHEGERANRTRERGATTARIIAERRGGMSGQDRGLTLTTQPYIGLLPYDG